MCLMQNDNKHHDYSACTFEDLRRHHTVFYPWPMGKKYSRNVGETLYFRTNLGDIEINEWTNAAKDLIARHNEDEIFNQLKEYFSSSVCEYFRKDDHALCCHISRVFDNEEWGGFIPFSQKYRPDKLNGVTCVRIKCKCCDEPGLITQKQYMSYEKYGSRCICPICGRLSEAEVLP
jgi:hypothetical protein